MPIPVSTEKIVKLSLKITHMTVKSRIVHAVFLFNSEPLLLASILLQIFTGFNKNLS